MSFHRAVLPHARPVGNSFAERHRAEKVARLINVLDLACVQQLKLDPIRDAKRFAVRLSTMGEEGWRVAARVASVNLPSATTRAAVVDQYFERDRLARQVSA